MTDEPLPTNPEEAPTGTDPEQATATAEAPAEDGDKKPEKLQQAVEIKDIGPCKKHIKVTIDRGSINDRLDDKFTELVKDAVVRGFRPGKAPRKVIERQFQKDVSSQVRGEVLMASLEQLADDHDLAPLSAPNIDPAKIVIPPEGPMIYEFDVEVRPEFDLPNYKGLKLTRPVRKIAEDDVDREQRRILANYGQMIPKDGAAEVEDYIIVDMTTRFGDKVIGEAKEVTMRVDPRVAFKDGVAETFGTQVTGARAGDKRIVEITMSDRVSVPEFRGQKVQATLEFKDVKQMRLPELTHEFLHTLGVHSEEQLREQIMVLLERRLEYQQRQSAREQVLQQLSAAASWQLPQDLLMRQARNAMTRRVIEMREAGMSEDEIRARQRLLQQDILASTAESLKEHFVLQKIAETEKIDIEEDEVNMAIEMMAEQNGESPRRVRAQLEREDMLEQLAVQLIERKVLDLILSSAEYEEVAMADQSQAAVGTVEEQAVPGEMRDPTAEQPAAEGEAAPESAPPAQS